jgi:hypothetical protein
MAAASSSSRVITSTWARSRKYGARKPCDSPGRLGDLSRRGLDELLDLDGGVEVARGGSLGGGGHAVAVHCSVPSME